MVVYTVLAGATSGKYLGDIEVLIYDNVANIVYNGSLSTYSTKILSSRFPINISVTPAINYLVATQSNISDASNITIVLLPIMTPIKYSLVAASNPYYGSLSVTIWDVNNNTIYSGNATTWNSTTPLPGFPLSIRATPNATFLEFTQTNISDMSDL